GALYDKDGHKHNWWTNSTWNEFNNKSACFVEQYGSIFDDRTRMHVSAFANCRLKSLSLYFHLHSSTEPELCRRTSPTTMASKSRSNRFCRTRNNQALLESCPK